MKYENQLQEQVIAKHLLAGKSITGLQALSLFGCYRLSNVILSLRREWQIPIATRMIQTGRKRYAVYFYFGDKTPIYTRKDRARWKAIANGKPIPRRERMKILGTARGMK